MVRIDGKIDEKLNSYLYSSRISVSGPKWAETHMSQRAQPRSSRKNAKLSWLRIGAFVRENLELSRLQIGAHTHSDVKLS